MPEEEAREIARFVVSENRSFPADDQCYLPATTAFAQSGTWDERIPRELLSYLATNGYHGDIVDLREWRSHDQTL